MTPEANRLTDEGATHNERWALAWSMLAARRYAEAWSLYEARRALRYGSTPTILSDAPEWDGSPITGRHIVVCAEQGLGDQIMFGRYLPLLREMGARVTVACDPRVLGRFFEAAGFAVAPLLVNQPLPSCDCWALIGSLPHKLGNMPPPGAKYVNLPRPERSGVGVMTAGGSANPRDAFRTLPAEHAERLLWWGRDLAPSASGARDIFETAQIMSTLEVVITVDTSVAHIAGAIGAPCWVLLPSERLDWRWNDGLRSDWYPAHRLFRQESPGDWRGVLDRAEDSLPACGILL